MNTTWFLSIPAMMFPEREALVFEDTRLTYAQLQDRVDRLTSAIRSLGLGRGSRVGMLQTNCSQYVEAYYATSKMGGIFVPLNYRSGGEELKAMINTALVDVLFVGDRFVDLASAIRPDTPSVRQLVAIDSAHEGTLSFDDLLSEASGDGVEEEMEGDETNVMIFTSGTTGLPKAVMLSYSNFLEYVFQTVEPADGIRWGATLLCAPLYHISGSTAIMSSIYAGRRLVLMRQFDALEWLRLAQQERITNAFLVPAMLKKLLDEPALIKSDLSSLETLTYGAAPMPLPVIRQAIETLPRNIGFINAFGQTETTATVTMLLPEDHRIEGSPEEIEKKVKRLGSIGRALPDAEIKVGDEDGQEVPRGEIGELVVRTSRLMKGYVGQERLSQGLLLGGWMRTRDLGRMDEDGYVFLDGRKDDLIIPGEGSPRSPGVETVLVYPDVSIEGEQQTWKSGRSTLIPHRETRFGRPCVDDVLRFLSTVYESIEIDRLRSNYLSGICDLVPASAYGFHLLEPQARLQPLLSGDGVADYFIYPETRVSSVFDYLPMHMVWTQERECGKTVAPGSDWRCDHWQEVVDPSRPAYFVRTPIVSADGRFLGALSFVRSGERPAFKYSELGMIRLVAHHMCVVLANALKYAEISERYSVAEGALQVIGAAVVVSDTSGSTKVANLQARRLMGQENPDPVTVDCIREGVRRNLLEMKASGKRIITSTIHLPSHNQTGYDCLALRSVRIPSGEQAVATFLYNLDQVPSFRHLSSLLSKREIDVLELVAQGLHNKEIAESLVVTSNTVKHHLKQIFLKMRVNSRSELLAKAFSSVSEG